MLIEDEKSERRYYSRDQAIVIAVGLTVFFIIMSPGLFISEYLGIKIMVVVALLLASVIGARFIRAGIEVFGSGVRVRNIFSTFELPWEEIERFEIGRSGLFPMVCLINLKNGNTRHAFGIQERTNFPNGSAEEISKELNAELLRRIGGAQSRLQVAPTNIADHLSSASRRRS